MKTFCKIKDAQVVDGSSETARIEIDGDVVICADANCACTVTSMHWTCSRGKSLDPISADYMS